MHPIRDHFQEMFCPTTDKGSSNPVSSDFLFIGELARQLGLNPKTIRYYENEGLIKPRRHGAFRTFLPQDVDRLKSVISMRKMGLSIATIKALFNIAERDKAKKFMALSFRQHLIELEKQRRILDSQLQETALFIEQLENSQLTHMKMAS